MPGLVIEFDSTGRPSAARILADSEDERSIVERGFFRLLTQYGVHSILPALERPEGTGKR
ncbi:MAG: hypothetical protein AB2L11_04605 [Syntrophobacteraceae bacterium]